MIHKFQKFLLILALGISSATAAQANGDIYSDAHGYIGRLEGTEIYSLANGYVGQIEGTEIYSAANGYLGYVDQNGDWHLRSDWFLTNSSQRNLSLGERMRMAVPEDWVRQSGYPQGVQPPAPAQPQVRRAEPLVSRRPTSAQATAAINRAQDAWHEPRIKGGVRYDPATDTYNWIGPSGQARSKPASWFLDKFGAFLDQPSAPKERRPTSAEATAAINRAQDAWHEPRIKGGVRYDPATDTYNWIGPSGQARSKPASWFLDKFGPYL